MSPSPARVLVLAADFFEESEVLYPVIRLREEGIDVAVAGLGAAPIRGKGGFGPYPVDLDVAEVDAASFDALVIPGGFAPDLLRRSSHVLDLVRAFDSAEKPIAQICHGGWVAISAGIVRDRNVTSVPAIRIDLENAGATWLDQPVVVDRNLISARVPGDLGPWVRALIAVLTS